MAVSSMTKRQGVYSKMAGDCQNGRQASGHCHLPSHTFPNVLPKPYLFALKHSNCRRQTCNPIETIVSYIRCTNTTFVETGDAMNKDEPIEVETRIKVIAGCVLPEPELLAPTPPIEQELASIEENIIKDE